MCVRARTCTFREKWKKKKQRTRVFAQRKKYKKCENSDWESNSENEIAQNGAVELIQWNGDDDEQIFFHTKIVPFVSRSRRVDANKWALGCVIKFQHISLFFFELSFTSESHLKWPKERWSWDRDKRKNVRYFHLAEPTSTPAHCRVKSLIYEIQYWNFYFTQVLSSRVPNYTNDKEKKNREICLYSWNRRNHIRS